MELNQGIRQARYFKKDEYPAGNIIYSFIYEAYKLTPSKQFIMPYKIHVFGPKNEYEKEILYRATKGKMKYQYKQTNMNYQVLAPYVLLFTSRLCSNPNKKVQKEIDRGLAHQSCDPKEYKRARKVPTMEVGMFCNNLSNICLRNGLNIAYTACYPDFIDDDILKNIDAPTDALKDVKDEIIYLSMSIGYADPNKSHQEKIERIGYCKPHINEIIDWH